MADHPSMKSWVNSPHAGQADERARPPKMVSKKGRITAMDSCLFCKIAKHELPSKVAFEDDRVVAFHDIQPQAPLHVLICPKKHIATLNEVAAEDAALLAYMFDVARKIADEAGVAQKGYRTVFNVNADAGQTVFHLHLHVIGGRRLSWP
jgi:histidine triad (HIT) family protein